MQSIFFVGLGGKNSSPHFTQFLIICSCSKISREALLADFVQSFCHSHKAYLFTNSRDQKVCWIDAFSTSSGQKVVLQTYA